MTSTEAQSTAPPPRPWRRWLQLVLALAILVPAIAWAVRHVQSEPGAQQRLLAAHPAVVVTVFVALLLVMVQNGAVLRALVGHLGVQLPVRSWLGVTFVASMLNLISPISGAGAMRGLYLKRVYNVPLTSFAGLLAVTFAFSVAVTGALAAGSVLALGVPGGSSGWLALAVSAALPLGLVVGLAAAPQVVAVPSSGGLRARLAARMRDALVSWRALSTDRRLVARLVVLNAAGALLHGVAFVAAFQIAGFAGPWLVPVASSAFARVGSLVSITPAGLGVYEAFAVVSAQIVGAGSAEALLGVLIVRVASTALSIVGGAAFSPLLFRTRGAP